MKKLFILFFTIALTHLGIAQVTRILNLTTAGTLTTTLTATEKTTVTNLTITGNIDARDVKCMRDEMTTLAVIDMSGVSIKEYSGNAGTYYSTTYPANEMPQYSFRYWNTTGTGKTVLTTIKLPTSVTSIGEAAFYGCSGLGGTITFPATLSNIGNDAFNGCVGFIITNLRTTPLAKTVESMGLNNSIVYVPAGTLAAYKTVWTPPTTVLIQEQDVAATVNVTTAGTLATTIFNQISKHPSLVTKLTVTGVLNSTDIYYIRDNMQQCYDVNLEGVSLTALPDDAFKNRPLLFFVKLPSNLKTIGNSAFYNCSLQKLMVLPSGVTSIGGNAFNRCSSLKALELPSIVTSLGYGGTFYDCFQLESINLPNGITSIPASTFHDCRSLKAIDIPANVSTIEYVAFKGCSSLTSITIGAKVSSIDESAFSGCTNLNTITSLNTTPPALGLTVFSGIDTKTCKLRIMQSAFNAYFSAPQWGNFLNLESITGVKVLSIEDNIIKLESNVLKVQANEPCMIYIYDFQGRILIEQKSATGFANISFVGMKNAIVKVVTKNERYVKKIIAL